MYSLSRDPTGVLIFTKENVNNFTFPSISKEIRPHYSVAQSGETNIKFKDWSYDHRDTIMDIVNVVTQMLHAWSSPRWHININENKMYDVLARKIYET